MRILKKIGRPLLLLLAALHAGCSLDIPMEDKVSDPKAISTISAMQRATAAAYYSYSWHSYDIVFSILAEEFQP